MSFAQAVAKYFSEKDVKVGFAIRKPDGNQIVALGKIESGGPDHLIIRLKGSEDMATFVNSSWITDVSELAKEPNVDPSKQ